MSKITTLIAGFALSAVSMTAVQANEIVNGGFEQGSTQGWVTGGPANQGGCDTAFNVGTSGTAAGCVGYAPIPTNFVAPQSGSYAAYAAFDGGGPLIRTLSQTFTTPLNIGSATVTWYDALGFGAGWTFPQSRVYSVDLLDSQNNVAANLLTETFSGGGVFQDWTMHSVDITKDLASLSNQSATLRFSLNVPGNFTGPGAFALDNVAINTTAAVPEPTSVMLIALGAFGLALARRSRANR